MYCGIMFLEICRRVFRRRSADVSEDPLSFLLGQLGSFFGVFDCAEVQLVAVVCRSSDLLVCCGVWYFFL
jgi:hypothetical protein